MEYLEKEDVEHARTVHARTVVCKERGFAKKDIDVLFIKESECRKQKESERRQQKTVHKSENPNTLKILSKQKVEFSSERKSRPISGIHQQPSTVGRERASRLMACLMNSRFSY
jgi:hypothetical protein